MERQKKEAGGIIDSASEGPPATASADRAVPRFPPAMMVCSDRVLDRAGSLFGGEVRVRDGSWGPFLPIDQMPPSGTQNLSAAIGGAHATLITLVEIHMMITYIFPSAVSTSNPLWCLRLFYKKSLRGWKRRDHGLHALDERRKGGGSRADIATAPCRRARFSPARAPRGRAC